MVVGIVVDQMRNDYIYRYWNRFGKGGFKRLINKGFYFRNGHYNYIPTYTGPGHCSIYTGATPRAHGIIANDWHLKGTKKYTYCAKDTGVTGIGAGNDAGKMSPKNQLSSTIGDELKMSSNQLGKVFGVALKDRSAILPGGHAANAAYWYDDATGNFISSSWYLSNLPAWVNSFNQKKLPLSYLQKGWNTLYPLSTYSASIADENRYEASVSKTEKAVFPYDFKTFIDKNSFGVLKSTPFGNSITKDFALECIKNEALGKDDVTDLFCISFSSTDAVAHSTGPRAVEVEDVYLRLDKDIEELLNYLDKEIGSGEYLVFLTADHGGADVPNHLTDNKIAAGYTSENKIAKELKGFCQLTFGDSLLIENVSNEQVFLNEKKVQELKLDKDVLEEKLCPFLITLKGVAEAYPSKVLKYGAFEQGDYRTLLQNGYNQKLSGNIAFIYQPAWMDYSEKGTTHGAGYNYDTHVPIIFYGKGIAHGESLEYVTITQIAPSVCELLKINQPNACTALPLNVFFKK
ncbi:MAG: alkaline phosphatase family protein [Bacteroidia bacterium]|nr:alkaline phosphatase family protein [Bacteroidia bacterium]